MNLYPIPRNGIVGALRKQFSRSPVAKHVREAALSDKRGPRGGKQYVCAKCGDTFPGSKVHVDHCETVVPLELSQKDMSWDLYIERLFCPPSNLQVLCTGCHDTKSIAENELRRQVKERAEMSRKINDAFAVVDFDITKEELGKYIESMPEEVYKKLTGKQIGEVIQSVKDWLEEE